MPVMKMRTALNIKRLAKYTQEQKIVIVILSVKALTHPGLFLKFLQFKDFTSFLLQIYRELC